MANLFPSVSAMDPKLLMMLAVGTLLLVSGILDTVARRRRAED